jgi:hypothetical protein
MAMKVGIFHVGPMAPHTQQLAQLLCASVRHEMPGVEIVHLTDEVTSRLPGADRAQRRPTAPFGVALMTQRAACVGPWLFLDTDTRVLRDVRGVFADRTFDIAVATREGTLKPSEVGTKFMAQMPFNAGVVFSTSSAFWEAARRWLLEQPEKSRGWMGDQRALNTVIADGRFAVKVLPASYNYPPQAAHEDLRAHAIVHFKGPRKAWGLGVAA